MIVSAVTNGAPGSAKVTEVGNAGLVLASPFLPRFFHLLQMTSVEHGSTAWVSEEAARRAPMLLQAIVAGRHDAADSLALNRLLCGTPEHLRLESGIDLSSAEHDGVELLLRAMLTSWDAVRQSTAAALRETFLQREGRLQAGSERWTLRVPRKTVDVLIDKAPWSFSGTRLPWMETPLCVEW